jgi:hypothetical protein
MNDYQIIAFGRIVAALARIEGMKAENWTRQQEDKALAYNDEAFESVMADFGADEASLRQWLGW